MNAEGTPGSHDDGTPGPRAGLVLAGGRSTRFGSADKAFAGLRETPMIGHVLSRLGHATDGLLVSCRDDQLRPLRRLVRESHRSIAVVPDPVHDRGPAAGIAAGLAPCRASYAAVVACDTPLVEPDFLSFLFELARGVDGAVPRIDGHLRPTVAVYRTDRMRAACEDALDSGDGSLRAALQRLDLSVVPEEVVERQTDPGRLIDVNTGGDLERAVELLERPFGDRTGTGR